MYPNISKRNVTKPNHEMKTNKLFDFAVSQWFQIRGERFGQAAALHRFIDGWLETQPTTTSEHIHTEFYFMQFRLTSKDDFEFMFELKM